MAQTFTQLRAFAAVARLGSVQLAARELYVTQPSVSSAVSALAKELGAELFERHARGVRISAAGVAYLPYATRMLGLVEEGQAAVQAVVDVSADTIRLIAAATAADHFMPALIDGYRRCGGGAVRLSVANRDTILQVVAAHDADIGITGPLSSTTRYKNLSSTPFLANELIVVSRHLPENLATATWLLREEGSAMRTRTELVLTQSGLDSVETLTLGSAGAVKQALLLGVGVSLVPRMVVSNELHLGELTEIPMAGTPMNRPWHAVTSADVPARTAVSRFVSYLLSDAAQELLRRG